MGVLTNDEKVWGLIEGLRDSAFDIEKARDYLRSVICEESWREFHTPNGVAVTHRRFIDFVTARVPEGLQSNPDALKSIAGGDLGLLDLIDQALRNAVGRPETRANSTGSSEVTGTTRAKALRKLRDDAPELHASVLAGNLSAHAAMVQAGFRPRTLTIRADDAEAIARTLRKNLEPDVLQALKEAL